jgi:hypothetical protein
MFKAYSFFKPIMIDLTFQYLRKTYVSAVGGKDLHAAAEKYIFSVVNVSGHRQDIEVLSTVLNVNFALI